MHFYLLKITNMLQRLGQLPKITQTKIWIQMIPSEKPRWRSGKESACQAGDLASPLGREDALEKEMITHSSIPAWKFHGQRSLMGYSPRGGRVGHDWAHTHDSQVFFLSTTPVFLPTNQKHKAKEGTVSLSLTTDKLPHTCTKTFKLISSQQ